MEILRRANAMLGSVAQHPKRIHPVVRDLAAEGFPVRLACEALGFPLRLYAWVKDSVCDRDVRDE